MSLRLSQIRLTRFFSSNYIMEIQTCPFSDASKKLHGPDGITTLFYQELRRILKENLTLIFKIPLPWYYFQGLNDT